jgi:enoyl-CoA hydratase/carnithine racemase
MSHIVVEQHGAVGILTIARRARMNSLDVATARDLRKAGLALARDRSVRAVIVRGDGGGVLQRRRPEVHPRRR